MVRGPVSGQGVMFGRVLLEDALGPLPRAGQRGVERRSHDEDFQRSPASRGSQRDSKVCRTKTSSNATE